MVCKECLGKREYEIRNAYDLSYSKVITCEYCHGTGVQPTDRVGTVSAKVPPKNGR